MIIIKYNNINPFENICPVPYVEFKKTSDGWWSGVKTFILTGQIHCCGLTFDQIVDRQAALRRNFSKNFKKLQIVESDNNSSLIEADYAYIKNIDFDESNYTYFLPFKIEIEAYDKNAFHGNNFVIDPVAEYSIKEEKNGIINYTFTVSAKGLNGNGIAPIDNAKNWVNSIAPTNSNDPSVITFTIPGLSRSRVECDPNNPQAIVYQENEDGEFTIAPAGLISSYEESYDRLSSTYKKVINFSVDPKSNDSTSLTYKVNIDQQKNSFLKVTVSGNVQGSTINAARNRLNNFDAFQVALSYSNNVSQEPINNKKKSFNVTENRDNNSISFSYVYDNQNDANDGYVEISATFNSKSVSSDRSKSKATISIKAEGTRGTKEERFKKAKELIGSVSPELGLGLLNSLITIGDLEQTGSGYDEDQSGGSVSMNYEYTGKESIGNNKPCSVKSLSGSVDENLPCQQYNFKRMLCSDWVAIPTHISNRKKAANLTLTYSAPDKKAEAMQYANSIIQQEAIGTQTKAIIFEMPQDSKVVYEYEWEELSLFDQ